MCATFFFLNTRDSMLLEGGTLSGPFISIRLETVVLRHSLSLRCKNNKVMTT